MRRLVSARGQAGAVPPCPGHRCLLISPLKVSSGQSLPRMRRDQTQTQSAPSSSMEESTLALAQSLARQTIYEESPPGSPKTGRSHAALLQEKVQGFR